MERNVNTKNPFLILDNSILNEINRIDESQIITKDIKIYSKALSTKYQIIPVALDNDKSKITSEIISRSIPRSRIPGGASYDSRGNSIVVELAKYTIPYSGEDKYYEVRLNKPNIYDFEFRKGTIIVELTSFNILTNNDGNKKEIAKIFLEFFDNLEKLVEEIRLIIEKYNENLENRLEEYLQRYVSGILTKRKNDSDINPFASEE
ncbi:hypothetical protein RT99_02425 [Flavobacterium sp. MEB061]|uniref:hypothetical protein n=1 Tax=Flavobacterium sp. MEB061 TaxID=1587524 RepID=UPI0005AC8C61|nr:hypothetical protein [Flavobacterium sp. MEB061]KIQ24957.1 hypothetical protein RT99_02425 [Flavobacterium sp. MEB061]